MNFHQYLIIQFLQFKYLNLDLDLDFVLLWSKQNYALIWFSCVHFFFCKSYLPHKLIQLIQNIFQRRFWYLRYWSTLLIQIFCWRGFSIYGTCWLNQFKISFLNVLLSTVLIYLIHSKFIFGKFVVSTVSANSFKSKYLLTINPIITVFINLFESKYLPTINSITMLLIDPFEPTSMSEKILTNKIYLTEYEIYLITECVLTNLIKH